MQKNGHIDKNTQDRKSKKQEQGQVSNKGNIRALDRSTGALDRSTEKEKKI